MQKLRLTLAPHARTRETTFPALLLTAVYAHPCLFLPLLTHFPFPRLRLQSTMGSPVSYMKNNIGWTFNFIVATIWFWAFGFVKVSDYGYSTKQEAVNTKTGAIESGAYGSGVFPLTFILWVVALLTWSRGLLHHLFHE